MIDEAKNAKIRYLNDILRKTGLGGQIMFTKALSDLNRNAEVMNAISKFDGWPKGNDPYNEHDFGAVKIAPDLKVFFKIDYYDKNLEYGSEDASNPEVTTRVMTVMLPEDY